MHCMYNSAAVYLDLGPVLVSAILVPQRSRGGPLVAHEGAGDGGSLLRVTGGQVHDDAHLKHGGRNVNTAKEKEHLKCMMLIERGQAHRGLCDGCSLLGVTGGQVHDDAHLKDGGGNVKIAKKDAHPRIDFMKSVECLSDPLPTARLCSSSSSSSSSVCGTGDCTHATGDCAHAAPAAE